MEDLSHTSHNKRLQRFLKPVTATDELPKRDLVPRADTLRLAHYEDGKKVDERPIIRDPVTGSFGKVNRFMYFRKDIAGSVGVGKCCLRFEVSICRRALKSHHHDGDSAIWSIPVDTVINSPELMDCMRRFKIGPPEIREYMKDCGFTPTF